MFAFGSATSYTTHRGCFFFVVLKSQRDTPQGSYGLTFGINTFLAIVVRVIIVNIVESLNRSQSFNWMGGILAFVGFMYILFMFVFSAKRSRNN